MDNEIIIAPHVRHQLALVKFWAVSIVTIVILALAGAGIWSQWDKMGYVGLAVIVALGIVLLCGVAAAVIAVLRFALEPRYRDVGEFGGYFTNSIGQVRPAAPMIASAVKINKDKRKTVVKLAPEIPSITDLIDAAVIVQGSLEMIQGYDKQDYDKGILTLVTSDWPGTHAVAGKGRSGKSRRVLGTIAQALIAKGIVTVCDPHTNKPDGISVLVAPLEPWLHTLARGDQQCVEATREFLDEMKRRVAGTSTERDANGQFIPRFIVLDEWRRLMTNAPISDEDRDMLKQTAIECSAEYAGFNGFCCLISQVWTEKAVGGTEIRRSLQSVFCHNLSPEYSKFFFDERKHQVRSDKLEPRECLYKNYSGIVREVVTIGIPDNAAASIAEYMMEIAPPAPKKAIRQAPAYRQTGPLANKMPEQLARHNYHQIAERSSNSWYDRPTEPIQAQNLPKTPYEDELAQNALQVRYEQHESFRMNEMKRGEGFTVEAGEPEKPAYTHEQEIKILKAYADLLSSGATVTRKGIMEQLDWTRAQWPAIKAVCDKHDILR